MHATRSSRHRHTATPPGTALLVLLLLLFLPRPSFGVTLTPGTLGPRLNATGCTRKSNCVPCPTSCGEADGNKANAAIDHGLLVIGQPFVNTAYSHLTTDFTVAEPAQGEGDWVTGTVYYDVGWKGLWTIVGVFTGANSATMDLSLSLIDLAAPSRVLVAEPIHRTEPSGVGVDIFEVGGWTDGGRRESSFTTQLRRGHTYRLTFALDLRTFALANAYYTLDYNAGAFGAWWNELRVALGPDPAELVARLGARVDTLEYRLEHHGHEYLTGRGEGQNNTVATTSGTVFFEDARDSTGTTDIGAETADVSPVSVLLRSNYPNPARRVSTIAFRLAAPAQVTIRLFDVRGRLVATLADEAMEAGERRVPFDVHRLAAGVYFYRLTAGPFTESRRLVVK
jgi:hypothetical protein